MFKELPAAEGQKFMRLENQECFLIDVVGFLIADAKFDLVLQQYPDSKFVVLESELDWIASLNEQATRDLAKLLNSGSATLISNIGGSDRIIEMSRAFANLKSKGYKVKVLSPDLSLETRIQAFAKIYGDSVSLISSPVKRKNLTTTKTGVEHMATKNWDPTALFGSIKSKKNVRVLIDTSSLMSREMPRLVNDYLVPWAKRTQGDGSFKLLWVPGEVVREMETLATKDPSRAKPATRGIKLVGKMKSRGVLEVFETGLASENQAADDVIMAVMNQLLLKYDLMLISQDKALAKDCNVLYNGIQQSEAHTGRKHRFLAVKIAENDGRLDLVKHRPKRKKSSIHGQDSKSNANIKSKNKSNGSNGTPNKKKRKQQAIREITPELIDATPYPAGTNSELFDFDGNSFVLAEKIQAGGEGTVYHIANYDGLVAKIYHKKQLTKWRIDKLKQLVNNPVKSNGVAWPSSLLTNCNGHPVGFVMPKVTGAKALGDSIFFYSTLTTDFPSWRRRHLVELARQLAHVVSIVHKRDEVVGDLNPANIMVSNKSGNPTVTLVDCDSWQFGGYPSPVALPEYLHNDLRGKSLSKNLRNSKHDCYALAIIIFQILFLGRHPFASSSEESVIEAMKNQSFRYPLRTGGTNEFVPKGFAWRVWTHMLFNVQRAFHQTFNDGRPVPARKWVEILGAYKSEIEQQNLDTLGNDDKLKPEAVRVPIGRKDGNEKTFVCGKCKEGTETFYTAEKIEQIENRGRFTCRQCVEKEKLENKKGASRLCEKCGTLFTVPIWFETMLESKRSIPSLCKKHGGLQYEIKCSGENCNRKINVNSFDQWEILTSKEKPLCNVCHKKERLKRDAERAAGNSQRNSSNSQKKSRPSQKSKSVNDRAKSNTPKSTNQNPAKKKTKNQSGSKQNNTKKQNSSNTKARSKPKTTKSTNQNSAKKKTKNQSGSKQNNSKKRNSSGTTARSKPKTSTSSSQQSLPSKPKQKSLLGKFWDYLKNG